MSIPQHYVTSVLSSPEDPGFRLTGGLTDQRHVLALSDRNVATCLRIVDIRRHWNRREDIGDTVEERKEQDAGIYRLYKRKHVVCRLLYIYKKKSNIRSLDKCQCVVER